MMNLLDQIDGIHPKPRKAWGSIWSSCGISKNVLSGENVKPCVFITFNILISHILFINFNQIPFVSCWYKDFLQQY